MARQDLTAAQAAAVARDGGVIAYPTESCFGLGCDPANETAVDRVLAAKGRARERGLILVGGDWEHLSPYMGELGEAALGRLRAQWPGPVTFLVPPAAGVPAWIRGGHPRGALRWTAHPGAAALCRAFGGALVSTSANREGRSALTSAEAVQREFGGELDGIMGGPVGGDDRPSAIIDVETGGRLR